MQGWFILEGKNIIQHTNRLEKKKHMITSIEGEKASDKTQCLFMIKILRKLGIKENFFNLIKTSTINLQLTSYSVGKRPNAFTLRRGMSQACPLLPLLFNIEMQVLASANKESKGNKRHTNRKGKKTELIFTQKP